MSKSLGYFLCSVAACALSAVASPAIADEQRATFTLRNIQTEDPDLEDRLEQAIGRVPDRPASYAEQRRNARRAAQLAEELLRSEGYYAGSVLVDSANLNVLAAFPDDEGFDGTVSIPPPEPSPAAEVDAQGRLDPPRLVIEPGRRFTIRDAGIEWVETRQRVNPTGGSAAVVPEDTAPVPTTSADPESEVEGQTLPFSGAAAIAPRRGSPPVHPEVPIVDLANAAIELPDGTPARAQSVITAESRVVSVLQSHGFADARAEPRYVEVVHPDESQPDATVDYTMRPRFNIMARDVVYLDDRISLNPRRRGSSAEDDPVNQTRTRESWVQQLVPWEKGDIYSPAALTELERRLSETGVFDAASVSLLPVNLSASTDEDGLRNVVVFLSDRPHKLLEAGASYATDDGFGLDAFRTHFNRFGRADTLRYGLRIASIDSRLGLEWSRPHFRRPGRTLRASAWAVNEFTDAYDRQALSIEAEATQRLGRTSYFNFGLGLDGGRYKETRYDPETAEAMILDRNLVMLTGRAGIYMDRSNDPLNATEGWRARLSLQPTAVTGEDTVFFLRSVAEASAYYPFGENRGTVVAGRLKLGSIVGGDELTIPSDRLLYSGGGGSVRGYSYQSINPRLPDNTPRGGLSLFETSLELRRDFGEKFQGVVFVDGGAVGFEETPNLSNMRYGAGVGVRYKLPFGPVRADIAVPLNKREGDSDFQIYISIGQSF